MVPVLEDGDFRLTECSAIIKYLADKTGSPAYPKDLKERARVHEMMDWFNSNIYKDFGYGVIYPQAFPHHKRPGDAVQAGTLEWGKQKTQSWLKILDQSLIGPDRKYLCGDRITLADYLGAEIIAAGGADRLQLCRLSQHRALAGQHEGAQELAQGARGRRRLRRFAQGQVVRHDLKSALPQPGDTP